MVDNSHTSKSWQEILKKEKFLNYMNSLEFTSGVRVKNYRI